MCKFKGYRKGTSRARRSRPVAKTQNNTSLITLEDQRKEPDTESQEPASVKPAQKRKRGFPSQMELAQMGART